MEFASYKDKQKWGKRVFKERGSFSWVSTIGNNSRDKTIKTKGMTYVKPKIEKELKNHK